MTYVLFDKKDIVLNIDMCIKYYQTNEYTLSFLILEICHKINRKKCYFLKLITLKEGHQYLTTLKNTKQLEVNTIIQICLPCPRSST